MHFIIKQLKEIQIHKYVIHHKIANNSLNINSGMNTKENLKNKQDKNTQNL